MGSEMCIRDRAYTGQLSELHTEREPAFVTFKSKQVKHEFYQLHKETDDGEKVSSNVDDSVACVCVVLCTVSNYVLVL